MKKAHALIVTIILGFVGSTAFAQKPKGKPKTSDPEPGTCATVDRGVKICATRDGQGSFDVITSPPAAVYIRFEEPITHFVPPDDKFFIADSRDNTATIAARRKDLPERTPAVITAGSVTVTLNLRPGSLQKADTQITVRDPRRGVKDVELEKLIASRMAPREKALAEAEKKLEQRSTDRAEQVLLEQVAQGVEIRDVRGKNTVRNAELIVGRAKNVVRIGGRRFLVFSVDNRSGENFMIKAVRLWVDQREVPGTWRTLGSIIHPGQEIQGSFSLPPDLHGRSRLKIEESDPKRDIELPEMEIP